MKELKKKVYHSPKIKIVNVCSMTKELGEARSGMGQCKITYKS